jgi:hypothetical protein
MKLAAAVLLLSLAAVPSVAVAQKDGDTASALADQDCARARKLGKPCVLTFGKEDIEGGVAKGDGTDVTAREMASFASLIRLRKDFRAEIIRAAEDL